MPISVNPTFLIVDKSGSLKEVSVKNINKDEIYKKCGFRKPEGFEIRATWENIKVGNQLHTIQLWARDEGKAGTENKYEFPPPVDTALYFGNCALVQVIAESDESYMSLTKELWLKIYEVLFGGFEEIADENDDDEQDPDELSAIKKEMKTKKTGYLKDGFVVDSDEEEVIGSDVDGVDNSEDDDDDDNDDGLDDDHECNASETKSDILENDIESISGGSELEEESYNYSDDEV